MDLLVAFKEDPAGMNMAMHIASGMSGSDQEFSGKLYDLLIIDTPAISSDWLEKKTGYDACVFLSKHAAASGRLALTCHSTGNFDAAQFGGNPGQMAVPYHGFQKKYMQLLWERRGEFEEFQITIEATHHGPTALNIPSIFVEVGTAPEQWNDKTLCGKVADTVMAAYEKDGHSAPYAVCFGGTHYPEKFTKMLLEGRYGLGTVVPKHSLQYVDGRMFAHILERNPGAEAALFDWGGLGRFKTDLVSMAEKAGLEIVRL